MIVDWAAPCSWTKRLRQFVFSALLAGLTGMVHAGPAQEPVELYRALNLSGTGYVEIAHDSGLNTPSSITVEAWVRRNNDTRCETVVGKGWQTSWWLGFCNQVIRFYGSGSFSAEDGVTPIPANVWTHIAVVYTQGSRRVYYVNGELDYFSPTNEPPLALNSLPIRIGEDPGNPGFQFDGQLAHVRIWNVPRSTEQIRRFMHVSIDEPLPGLVANWRLAGPTHGNYQDNIGGFHGSPQNTVGFTTSYGSPAQSLRTEVDSVFNRLPHNRYQHAGVYLPHRDQALLVGGYRGSGVSAQIDLIDGATGEVTTDIGSLPQALAQMGAAYVPSRNLVYTFGGANQVSWGAAGVDRIFAIDPDTGSTREVSPGLPVGLNAPAAVYHPGHHRIYIFGGRSSEGATDLVHAFDPETEQVSTVGTLSLPEVRSHLGAVYSELTGQIFLLGGFASHTSTAGTNIWQASIAADGTDGTITPLPSGLPRSDAMMQPVEDPQSGLIYLAGSWSGYWVMVFDPASQQVWRTRIALPRYRHLNSTLISPANRHALVVGGGGSGDSQNIWRVPLGDGPPLPIGDWQFPSPVSSRPNAIDGSGRGVVVGTQAHGAYHWRSHVAGRTVYTPANLGSASGRVNDVRYEPVKDHAWIATHDAGVSLRGSEDLHWGSGILGTSQARAVDFRPGYTGLGGSMFFGTGGQGLKWQRFIFDPTGPGYYQWQTAFPGQHVTSITHRQAGDLWVIANDQLKRLQLGTLGGTETNFGSPCGLSGTQDVALGFNGDWWLGADFGEFDSGLCRLAAAETPNVSVGNFTTERLGSHARTVDVDSEGRIWISLEGKFGTSGGVAAFEVPGASTSQVMTSEFNWENAPLGSRTAIFPAGTTNRLWDSSVSAAGAVDEKIWMGKPDGRLVTHTQRWRGVDDAHELLYYDIQRLRLVRGRAYAGGPWGFHVLEPDGATWHSYFDFGLNDAIDDHFGRIWLATSDGVLIHEPWGFDDLSDREGSPPIGNVHALATDRDGRVWIGSDQGLTLYDRERFVFNLNSANSGLPANSVRALFVDSGNRLWIGTSAGLARLDADRVVPFTSADGLPDATIESINQLGTGEIVVNTVDPVGIHLYDETGFSGLTPPYSAPRWPITVDQDGRLWAGRAVRIGGQWQTFHTTNSGLKTQNVTDVMADRADQVWFAHGGGGLSIRGAYLPPLANAVPMITSVSHTSGGAGLMMDIHGSGFGGFGSVRVFIGSGEAIIREARPDRIRVEVAPENTSGPIVVQSGGRRVTAAQHFCAIPSISHFTPTGGTQGTEVIVHGGNFDRNVAFSTGGAERQVSAAATEFRFTISEPDQSGLLNVRNLVSGCDYSDTSETRFQHIGVDVDRVMLNQGHKSMGLAGNKPTVIQHYLTTDHWVRAGDGFSDRVDIDTLRISFTESGQPPRTFTIPVETRPPTWPPPWPVASDPPSEMFNMPLAWYQDIGMSLNATLTPWLEGGGPVEVVSTLLNRGQVIAENTRIVEVRESQLLNVLLVPIMRNDYDSGHLNAMRTGIDTHLEDSRLRQFHFGRVNYIWSPMVFRANDILWDENEQVDVLDAFELYMASHSLERARRSWNGTPGRPKATIAVGVVDDVAVSGGKAGMAFWPDTSVLVNALGLSALDALCEFTDAAIEFFTLGALGGDGCDIEVPLYVAWVAETDDPSRLITHEVGHTLGLVRSHASNGSTTMNPSHSVFDEISGDSTCNDVGPHDSVSFDASRTLYRSPGFAGPVVNPLTGIQFLPEFSSSGTWHFDGVPYSHRAFFERGKAVMSYACGRGNSNTFFEPADFSHLRFDMDPFVLERGIANLDDARRGGTPIQMDGRRILISGQVNRAEVSGELVRVEVLGEDVGPLDASYETGWTLIQRDVSGAELSRRGLFPVFTTTDHSNGHDRSSHESDLGFFATTLLADDGVVQIDLTYHGTLLDSFVAGPGVPSVSIASPEEGKVYQHGEIPVQWTASDPDNDDLSITIHYSADDGVTWVPVGFGEGSGTVGIPVSVLAGSTQARVRVVASDGFQAGSAISGAFTVTPKPPAAFIASPDDGAVFLEGQRIRLSGGAWDAGMHEFAAADFTWISDRDGEIGQGDVIKTMLSVGTHTITLQATNAHNLTGLASINLVVSGDYDGDGVADDDELSLGFNPLFRHDVWIDDDGDGLPWIMEDRWGTDPFDSDSSGSGQSDADDIAAGLDPLDPEDSLPVDFLAVHPTEIHFYDDLSLGTLLPHERVQIVSRQAVAWTVVSNRNWLKVLRESGTTPDGITVVAHAHLLPDGTHYGALTFQSELGEVVVPVTVTVEGSEVEIEDSLYHDRFESPLIGLQHW
jgi:ligand-binding sensor domain-containing protein